MQMLLKRFVVFTTFVLLVLMVFVVRADSIQDPQTYMEQVTNQLLKALDQNKTQLNNKRVVSKIIYDKVVPYFDLGTMSRSVLGRGYWGEASPEQRTEFTHEFTEMIVNTYATAVEQYDGDKVKFHPLRTNYNNYRLISLSSDVIRPNGNKILLKYQLIRRGDQWRVYDFSIENISMVSSYRSQFSGVLHKSGVAGLIARLKSHNSKVNQS